MAGTVKASCPICGDFDIPSEKILVVLYPQVPKQNYISFNCPACTHPCERHELADGTLMALVCQGSPKKIVMLPAEVLEDHPILPAMTQDDVLDFMLEIEREDNLSALAS